MRLRLLGTGTPTPSLKRMCSGYVVETGDDVLVFDHGFGVHHRLLDEDKIFFLPAPSRVMVWSEHPGRVGLLSNKAASWKDYFFDNVHTKPGS